MKAKKLYPDKSIKRIWNKIKDLEKNGTGSGGSGSGSTNGTVLVLLANNWVSQSDGTFTNTVPMSEFTSNMMVEIDLYNDGSLTETQITEYNSYISKFNINDGEIVAIATTQPTQTVSIICRGDFSISEDIKVGNLSQVMEKIDEQNQKLGNNFSSEETLTNDIWYGKPLYRKVVYISSLPNSTTGIFNHEASNVDYIMIDSSHSAFIDNTNQSVSVPNVATGEAKYGVTINVNKTSFNITTGVDRSNWKAYITILYTKTTD